MKKREPKNAVNISAVDPITFLKDQHREVKKLFKEIEKTSDRDHKAHEALFGELAHKLAFHMEIEEKVFYPAGKEVAKGITLEAYEEHAVVRQVIQKISSTKASDESYTVLISALKDLFAHHVQEEENTYFPAVENALSQDKLRTLGSQLVEMFEGLENAVTSKSAGF